MIKEDISGTRLGITVGLVENLERGLNRLFSKLLPNHCLDSIKINPLMK